MGWRCALAMAAVAISATALVWWRWLFFYAYPILHGGCHRPEVGATLDLDGTAAGKPVVLLMNLDRSRQRLASAAEQLTRHGIREWSRVPAIDKWTMVPALKRRRPTSPEEMVEELLRAWRPELIATLFGGELPSNSTLVRALHYDWTGRERGHYVGLLFTFLRALALGLHMHERASGRPGGPGWLLVMEDDFVLYRDFRARLAETARRLPRSDLVWLDHGSWSRAWWHNEPACCTAGMLVRVEAVPRIARMMLPGSAETARYRARRGGQPLYDLVLSYLCVSEGLCCVVHDLVSQNKGLVKT